MASKWRRVTLQTREGGPVGGQFGLVCPQRHPSNERLLQASFEENHIASLNLACQSENRLDNRFQMDRREWEPDRSAAVCDVHPAFRNFGLLGTGHCSSRLSEQEIARHVPHYVCDPTTMPPDARERESSSTLMWNSPFAWVPFGALHIETRQFALDDHAHTA